MFYYMHNNTNYQCKICWNKALTFGVGSIQLSFRIYIPLCSPNTCKYVFNPNFTTFQSNCAESLHFSAFIIAYDYCALSQDFKLKLLMLWVVYLCVAHLFTNVNWIELAVIAFV